MIANYGTKRPTPAAPRPYVALGGGSVGSGAAAGVVGVSIPATGDSKPSRRSTGLLVREVPIAFPFTPYECQVAFMASVVQALQEGSNALLESPTGTGKVREEKMPALLRGARR